jgi:(E)-4-hydroxy-3-methyl-but-2-enyl pyrophosphate reductase
VTKDGDDAPLEAMMNRDVIYPGGLKTEPECEIVVATHGGFCFGVKRAVDIAFKAVQNSDSKPMFTLGPLIHNPQVVDQLSREGIEVINSLNELNGGKEDAVVIIRSHGVPKGTLVEARKRGIEILDATCPFVKRAQSIVEGLAQEEYLILVLGDEFHPEVQALLSYGDGKAVIWDGSPVASGAKKVAMVSQTTQPLENLKRAAKEVVNTLSRDLVEFRVFNTICESTTTRQNECANLAKKADLMIVVGGTNSANTGRLAEIARSIQERTYHIETEDQVDPAWFEGIKRVAVTAGASTPDWIIKRVVARIAEKTGGSIRYGAGNREN